MGYDTRRVNPYSSMQNLNEQAVNVQVVSSMGTDATDGYSNSREERKHCCTPFQD